MVNDRMRGLKLSIRRISELASVTPNCLRFDIGQPDFDTPQHIKASAIKAIEEGFTSYTSGYGIRDLRSAIAEKENRKGLEIEADNVLVTSGGIGALSCCFLSILRPGDEVLVSDPCWAPYGFITVNAHGTLVQTRFFDQGEFRPESIEANINNRTRAIIVNTPENPTGRVLEKKQLEEIVDLAERRNLFLISDEVYEKIIFEGATHYSLAAMAPERTFLINSCSKTYAMTGWRIGWVTGPEEYMDSMMKINRALIACPSSISQRAALSALTGPQDCVEVMRKEYEMRMEYAVHKFETMGLNFEVPKGTFYLFPDIQQDPWQFSLSLLENKQVSVVPGDAFGSAGKTCVRIALTVRLDMMKEGLNRFEEHLSDGKSRH